MTFNFWGVEKKKLKRNSEKKIVETKSRKGHVSNKISNQKSGRSTRSLESGFFFTPFFTAYSPLGWAVPVREYFAVYVPSSQLILQYVVIFEIRLVGFCRIAVVSYR